MIKGLCYDACMQIQPKEFFLPFIKKEQIAKNTYSFFFDRSGHPFDFFPGQYNRVFLELAEKDERGSHRSFTICSSPQEKDILMITTKIVDQPSPFKQKFNSLIPGEKVRFFGPMGMFTFPEKNERPLVFLAGGIGITPFHSMLVFAAASNIKLPITLFVSFSSPSDVIFYDELMGASQNNSHIKIVYTITHQEPADTSWDGETGRINAELLKKYIPDVLAVEYYVCGPSLMVSSMLDMLHDMKIPFQQIREEQFTGY